MPLKAEIGKKQRKTFEFLSVKQQEKNSYTIYSTFWGITLLVCL